MWKFWLPSALFFVFLRLATFVPPEQGGAVAYLVGTLIGTVLFSYIPARVVSWLFNKGRRPKQGDLSY